jgi:hypothetical protein
MTNDKKYRESAFRAVSDGWLTPGVESGRPAKSTRAGPRVVADMSKSDLSKWIVTGKTILKISADGISELCPSPSIPKST